MFKGTKRDNELIEKFRRSDNAKFYEQLMEYYIDRGQPIKNAPWVVSHDFTRSGSCFKRLCCRSRTSNNEINVTATISKPLFFRDEVIELFIDIDNSKSNKTIENIEVSMRQIIDIKTR